MLINRHRNDIFPRTPIDMQRWKYCIDQNIFRCGFICVRYGHAINYSNVASIDNFFISISTQSRKSEYHKFVSALILKVSGIFLIEHQKGDLRNLDSTFYSQVPHLITRKICLKLPPRTNYLFTEWKFYLHDVLHGTVYRLHYLPLRN